MSSSPEVAAAAAVAVASLFIAVAVLFVVGGWMLGCGGGLFSLFSVLLLLFEGVEDEVVVMGFVEVEGLVFEGLMDGQG